jgi:hypothetical protein
MPDLVFQEKNFHEKQESELERKMRQRREKTAENQL